MLKSFDIKGIINDLLKSSLYKTTMVNMNRTRLFNTGKDIQGDEIETFSKSGSTVYAKRTIEEKMALDLPTNRVTGFMTGKMYESFTLKPDKSFIDIVANKTRFDQFLGNISSDHDTILGLTEENKAKIVEMLKRDVVEKILNEATQEHFIDTELMRYV